MVGTGHFLTAVLVAAALACGSSESRAPLAGGMPFAPVSAADAAARSGSYELEGVTVQAESGLQREIQGNLQLTVREDGRYQVAFELDTTAPDLPGNVPVQVRGSGQGFVVGGILTGTTEEWMTLEPPPGGLDAVDLTAELPARAGRKIVSTSQASFDAQGVIRIVLQNQSGRGEYEPSVTVLAGRRAGSPPAVAAPPPAHD